MTRLAAHIRILNVAALLALAACSSGGSSSTAIPASPSQNQSNSHTGTIAAPRVWLSVGSGIAHVPGVVDVYDPASRSVVKTLGLDPAPVPPAVNADSTKIYVPFAPTGSSGAFDAIAEVNTATYDFTTIHVGDSVNALAISPDSRFLYFAGTSLHRINLSSHTIVASTPALVVQQGDEHPLIVSSDGLTLYGVDTSTGTRRIMVLDASTLAVRTTFGAALTPISLAGLSRDGHVLFALGVGGPSSGTVTALDSVSGAVVHTVALPDFPEDVVFDSFANRIYALSANFDTGVFKVTLIDATTYHVTGTVTAARGATQLAIDPVSHAVWFSDANGLHRIDPSSCAVTNFPLDIGGIFALAVTN